MTLAIRLVLAVLAVYRVAHLIGLERGPFDVALRFRLAIARRFPAVKQYGRASYQHWLAEGVTCPLCISFWLAGLGALAVLLPTVAGDAVLIGLGLAGAVLVLHRSAL